MYKRDRILLLEDIHESALKIKRYILGQDYDSFCADEKTKDAVIRNFEVIGEAANRIDDDYRLQNPELEWKRIRGFRNRIIHEYFGVDYEIVWTIIENDLDQFIEWLEILIEQESTL